jgi:ABC-type transport system substrate-binding protein
MTRTTRTFLFLFLSLALLLQACGTTDTVEVVDTAPRADRAEEEVEEEEAQFYELNIGLNDPVTNFDPLYARNLSTQRILSLIYEGLVTLDSNGEPQPALAREIDVSDDGLVYTFTINRDIFYHDSRVFTAGVGRRVHAVDVKWAFERAARAAHPSIAAELLMDIRGYENYYLEQRNIYDPERRVLQEVSGIQVVDEQTVRIELNEADPDFLAKLASPNLLIYPQEAVRDSEDGLSKRPVGTGHYVLHRLENDNQVILTKNQSENSLNRENRPEIDRLNFRYFDNEEDLYQEFSDGNLDWIPELGPMAAERLTNSSYELRSDYRDSYSLAPQNAERITAFYLNRRAAVNHDWLRTRLAYLTAEDLSIRGDIILNNERFILIDDAQPESEYYIAYTENYVAGNILTQLHNLVFQPDSQLVFFDIRVTTRSTSIYTDMTDSIRQNWNPISSDFWLRVDTKILSLYHPNVTGVQTSAVPWNLHMSEIRVRNGETVSVQ